MAAVLSVQKHTMTIASGSASATATLTGTPDTTQITCQHATNGSPTDVVLNWEVVEWEVGGGAPAPRRVMVI